MLARKRPQNKIKKNPFFHVRSLFNIQMKEKRRGNKRKMKWILRQTQKCVYIDERKSHQQNEKKKDTLFNYKKSIMQRLCVNLLQMQALTFFFSFCLLGTIEIGGRGTIWSARKYGIELKMSIYKSPQREYIYIQILLQ